MRNFIAVLTLCAALVVPATFAGDAHSAPGAISAEEIRQLQKSEPDKLLLLDVRTPREYQRGHLPGSILVPMNQVPNNLHRIARERKIVVVCATGARSGAVTNWLSKQGYPWVKNYTGGVMDWSRRGLPLER